MVPKLASAAIRISARSLRISVAPFYVVDVLNLGFGFERPGVVGHSYRSSCPIAQLNFNGRYAVWHDPNSSTGSTRFRLRLTVRTRGEVGRRRTGDAYWVQTFDGLMVNRKNTESAINALRDPCRDRRRGDRQSANGASFWPVAYEMGRRTRAKGWPCRRGRDYACRSGSYDGQARRFRVTEHRVVRVRRRCVGLGSAAARTAREQEVARDRYERHDAAKCGQTRLGQ